MVNQDHLTPMVKKAKSVKVKDTFGRNGPLTVKTFRFELFVGVMGAIPLLIPEKMDVLELLLELLVFPFK